MAKNKHPEITFDDHGNILMCKHSEDDWYIYTRDSAGNVTKYEDWTGTWYKRTWDGAGRELTFEDCANYRMEYVRDKNGKLIDILC
jgi:YD repeat-containing protein